MASDALSWEPQDTLDAPPLLCDECNQIVEDGEGDYEEGARGRFLCWDCYQRGD